MPAKLPKKILEQRGSWRAKEKNRQEFAIDPQAPTAPYDLDPEVRAEWDRIVPMFEALGIIGEIDAFVLVRWCETWVLWLQALSKVKEEGAVAKSSRGVCLNPWANQLDKLAGRLNQLSSQLAMSPTDRVRIPKKETKGEEPKLKLRIG